MTELQKLAYQLQAEAFFDELHQLEKQAMLAHVNVLQKEALNPLSLAIKGGKMMHSQGLAKSLKHIGRAWDVGNRKGSKVLGAKLPPGVLSGIANVARTPQGALALTAGGAAVAGAAGTGYIAGRGGGSQNVYVR